MFENLFKSGGRMLGAFAQDECWERLQTLRAWGSQWEECLQIHGLLGAVGAVCADLMGRGAEIASYIA